MSKEKKEKKEKAEQDAVSTGCTIVCPPDRHIPVEFHEIYSLVRTGMSIAERSRFEQIAQLVESLYAQEFMALKRNIRHNFLRFSMGAKDQPLISCVGGGLPTVAELDIAEQKLIADFMQLMVAARFHILTTGEWELAKADKFMFSLPVEVNWSYYDDKMLRTFWSSTAERRALRSRLPDLSDRVLVFHRGITVAQASGLYTGEKVDLLVDYLITQPLMKLWNYLRGRAAPPPPQHSLNLTDSDHSARKVVERRTLRLLMPTAWAVIKNLHKKLKLQEPAFKEVVVLYRAALSRKKHKLPALQRPLEQRQREILAGRNIHIKCFHDIPMADMDVIFAEKKARGGGRGVYLKMLTIIQMVVTVVGGLAAALMVLLKLFPNDNSPQGDVVDMNVLWSSISLVAARCGQVYTSAQAERSKTIQDMVNILYDKTDDAQEGVVSMLLEDMAEQQLKEAILTYGLLYSREAELTEELIDLDCERFLVNNFDLSVDFAVEDALPRLESWGMVKRVPNRTGNSPNHKICRFEAVHPETAASRLLERWQSSFSALSRPPETATFPLSNLVAAAAAAAAASPAPAAPSTPLASTPVKTSPSVGAGGGGDKAGARGGGGGGSGLFSSLSSKEKKT
ncbi:hypothetical protein VOLCADRAFT_95056 [Volvox carteri f. nagariensis]|uniref:Uncharacterized protein n=1 Tax=Volvox carteri f. nagariensis TaxID=3068 RepID=D8U6H1_VOLCA|nr:uncharacterized protein VOLCADRAFT_95056 [Volvox carteri f. nagariensis]EFJ44712.1 hypothetical protein VOLCADRAFT_95056 [Volvox carteri f. nagariensis]|eukprot:XP_002954288.1 hypothetical protein VOLCADRAFT_95056 [Volvox carteri f. nagariensis]